MKKNFIAFMIFLVGIAGYAQMAAAKKLPPNVQETIKINAPGQEVWDYLLKFDTIEEFGAKIVSKSTNKGSGLNALRDLTLKDGTIRHEELVYMVEDTKTMSVEVLNPGKEFEKYFYIFEVKNAGDSKCKVALSAFYGFNDKYPESKVKKEISKEFAALLEGLKQKFEGGQDKVK